MTPAAQAIAGTPILRPPSIRCRSLTLSGRMCRATTLRGQDLCVRHAEHRYPVLQRGPDVTLPLLEDLESVQIFATQVMQGVLADSIDIHRAGKLLYGCQIIANTMPRPARLKPSKEQESPAEPVTEVFSGPDFHLLGPIEDTRKQARFDSYWSFDKFRYEQECERLGRPAPKTPADMPESGWLNPEDLDRISYQRVVEGRYILNDGYREKSSSCASTPMFAASSRPSPSANALMVMDPGAVAPARRAGGSRPAPAVSASATLTAASTPTSPNPPAAPTTPPISRPSRRNPQPPMSNR